MNFNPTEIIFSATTSCNLHCRHCFLNRFPVNLSIQDAINFMKSCKENPDSQIDTIGFSGGEPFLYFDFILKISKAAIEMDFMFDQIMTNGDWWKTKEDLQQTLQKLYDTGYDGKIGLSWDNFHGQNSNRIKTFIDSVQQIFGNDSINIQYVEGEETSDLSYKIISEQFPDLKLFKLPQTFISSDSRAWKSRKWFKEDYCQGPGNIFFIHPDGNIAPCCGFANENPKLFIGNIKESYSAVMKNASQNEMIKICFDTGLSKQRKIIKKQLRQKKQKLPGKSGDICSFCDYICKMD